MDCLRSSDVPHFGVIASFRCDALFTLPGVATLQQAQAACACLDREIDPLSTVLEQSICQSS